MPDISPNSAFAHTRCSSCGIAGARRRARVLPNLKLEFRTLCLMCKLAQGFNYQQERPTAFLTFQEEQAA